MPHCLLGQQVWNICLDFGFTFMQHAAESAFEIRRKVCAGGTQVCTGRPEPMAGGRGKDDLSPWLCHCTCLCLPPFLCLLYFDYKPLAVAAHNSLGRPWPQGASQAQHDMKTDSSGGDLQDYKNTGECFISSVSCCSGISARGHHHHYTATLITMWSSLTIKLYKKNTTAFQCIATTFSTYFMPSWSPAISYPRNCHQQITFSQTQAD